MDDKKLQQLNKLLGALDTSAMSQEEILKGFELIRKHVEEQKEVTKGEIEALRKFYTDMVAEFKEKDSKLDSRIAEIRNEVLKEFESKIKPLKDGYTPIKGKDYRDGIDGYTPIKGVDYRDGIDGINGIDGKIDEATLGYLEDEIKKLKDKANGAKTGWGAHPLKIFDGTTLVDKVARVINFGTNLSATRSADGVITVNASGGSGSGLNKETPTGTVDDSNTSFTVSNEPFFINVNGAIYEVGDGLYASYVAGTITLSSPVGTGGFIKSYYA